MRAFTAFKMCCNIRFNHFYLNHPNNKIAAGHDADLIKIGLNLHLFQEFENVLDFFKMALFYPAG